MKTIQEKLFQTFLSFKEKVAIEYGDRKITYLELDKCSNRIANILAKNYGKGAYVGIVVEDRLEFITTMVGIFKAGCVFVPLEPTFPTNRLCSIIELTGLELVICDDKTIKQFRNEDHPSRYSTVDSMMSYCSDEKPNVDYSENDEIYIYHTSGSTGQPKAVIGKNISLLHFIAWETRTFSIDDSFRFSQFTNVGFDVFLRDTLVPLCAGACVCIPEKKEIILEASSLIQWIDMMKINLIHCVPSLFSLINSNKISATNYIDLKYVLLAGEKIHLGSLRNWFDIYKDRIQLVNLYGPTETTLAKVFYLIKEEDKDKNNIPVGKPIDGAQVIILNEEMKVCDQFETGEVYIRTPYISYGYLNNKELTNEVFIKNPFTNEENDILYKTGDLGRWLSDGNIELLGRIDRQIKIRGMRIELEEIERMIMRNSDIEEALVVKKELSETVQFLYAYVALEDSVQIDDESLAKTLIDELKAELPEYMVPAYIITLDKIPRKINGKIDYSMLKDPFGEQINIILPRDEIENKLLATWKEILGIDDISIDDSFFEKGGNSLNLMNLILKINEDFQVEINFEQIAIENTIERQATFIKKAIKQTTNVIPSVMKKEYYSASAAQRRMYYVQEINEKSCIYNLPMIAKIKGKITKFKLESILNKLTELHESLRTSFEIRESDLVQIINEDIKIEINELKLGNEEDINQKIKQLVTCFNLSKAPLYRVFFYSKSLEEHIIVFDFHHIIFDGFSQSVFLNDFISLYNNEEIQPISIQYKDYAEYQNSTAMKEIMLEQERFWLNQFKGTLPSLKLPEIAVENDLSSTEIAFQLLHIDESKLNKLKDIAHKNDTTLFVVLLTVNYMLLSKIGNEKDIIIGIPTSGRNYNEVDRLIGMFVNTIALRQYPEQNKTFNQLLSEVKVNMINALKCQDYQYDELVNKLNINRTNRKQQLFDVMFQMQKRTKANFDLKDIQIDFINLNVNVEFKLEFTISEYEDHLIYQVLYSKALFEEEFITTLVQQYENIIDSIIKDNNVAIKAIITINESDQLKASNNIEIEFDLD